MKKVRGYLSSNTVTDDWIMVYFFSNGKSQLPPSRVCNEWLNEYKSKGRYFSTYAAIYFELPEDAMAFQMTWM